MLAVALAAIVVVACSAVIGQGLCALGGRRDWAWWAPGAGFAALLAIAGVLVRLPGNATTALAGVALALVVSLALPSVRRALVSAVPEGVPPAAFVLLASMIPLFVWGRAGIFGEGMNNDSGAHLGTAWWLQHHLGPAPVGALGGALVQVGYPLGPHGVVAALSLHGVSLEHAFDAMIIAVAPLTALVALGALRGARLWVRWVAAVVVALSYMAVSFQMQASFKETIEALLVLAVALSTRDLLREPWGASSLRAGIPLGVTIAGSVYVYSFGGLVWTLGTAGAVALFAGPARIGVRALPGFLLGLGIVLAPSINQMARFIESPFNSENGQGNLPHAISAFETLGVWFNYDFRWTPDPLWPTIVGIVIACLAAAVALTRLLRAHRLVLASALVPVLAVYAYATAAKSIYLSAKGAAIAAPLVALTVAAGLVSWRGPRVRAAVVLLAGLACVAAGYSSFLVLRGARVGPLDHRAELAEFRAKIREQPLLFFPKDDMAQWDLVGKNVTTPRGFYAPLPLHPDTARPISTIGFYDFDSYTPDLLDRFTWAVTTNTPFQSHPPPNWHVAQRTRSYVLWRRHGPSRLQLSTDFATEPGRPFDCTSPFGRLRIAQAGSRGYAAVMPRPVVGIPSHWRGLARDAGQSASMTLRVPRGRWDLSLTYASNPGLRVEGPGLRVDMPATIDRVGPYYLAGTVVQRRSGPLTIRVTQDTLTWFGRLIGADGRTRGLDTPGNVPLGGVALTRHGAHERRVPVRRACGRYVDHVVPRP